jgi:hypothetical protein
MDVMSDTIAHIYKDEKSNQWVFALRRL